MVGIVQTLFVPSSWLSTTSDKTAVFAFFGLGNFALTLFNDGYFSPRVEFNAFTHMWSLGVEEQFYIFFPFIFLIWAKYKSKVNWVGYSSSFILSVLILISFAFCIYQTGSQPDKAFYLLPSRFWELGLGALLFQIHHNAVVAGRSSNNNWSNIAFILGGLAILFGLVLSDPRKFPFPWAVLPVVGTMLLIHSLVVLKPHFVFKSLLENRSIVYVGKISYSLYLWHWPVFVLFRWTSGLGGNEVYAIVLTALLSVFSYHFIETPFRKKIKNSANNSLGVVKKGMLAIVLSALFLGVGV